MNRGQQFAVRRLLPLPRELGAHGQPICILDTQRSLQVGQHPKQRPHLSTEPKPYVPHKLTGNLRQRYRIEGKAELSNHHRGSAYIDAIPRFNELFGPKRCSPFMNVYICNEASTKGTTKYKI